MTRTRHLDPNWQAGSGRRFDERDIALALAVSDEWETATVIARRAEIQAAQNPKRRSRIRRRLDEIADSGLIEWREVQTAGPNGPPGHEFRRRPTPTEAPR